MLYLKLSTIETGITSKLNKYRFRFECQALVRPEYVSLYKELAIDSFRKSGEYFKLKCPLTGEAKSGKNWMETH
jgi:hypothetical protein